MKRSVEPARTGNIRASGRPGMIGIIDIGSNSLRLVIYDGISRSPQVLFNEKVMCGLGRGMNASGVLNPKGLPMALDNVERFVALARSLGVERLDAIATSAVRDANDGPTFIAELKRRCGLEVEVISGDREGQLASLGVVAGLPEADGIAGDLGGGSVELITTGGKLPLHVASLALGPLRLLGEGGEAAARVEIDRELDGLEWLTQGKGRDFYAVGGAWRAIARIYMEHAGYPLHILHNYAPPLAEFERFLELLFRQSKRSLEKLISLANKRQETLPLAAYLLHRLLGTMKPRRIVFSAYGLREGHLYDLLTERERLQDPLLCAAGRMAAASPRFGLKPAELMTWTEPLFAEETLIQRRWREAAAIMSDIGWPEHPDYREEQVFMRSLRMPVPGLDHRGRVFIACALHARYGGRADAPITESVRPLLDDDTLKQSLVLGHALRLAYTLVGGASGLLGEADLRRADGRLVLTVPKGMSIYTGEAVRRRLETLGRVLGCEVALDGSDKPTVVTKLANRRRS
ncbi:MAG TPA: Ppx/GppA family phosphatase [Stellaceae bacterium]|jgi:exopolyphosphatase/guanosine-5'-triphosphate,3'-diphosphate pyrophosphatase|nr:Ppx/GppA family phosphatase [Stellaceae bacterium]